MRSLAKFATFLMLLLMGMPAIACMLPGAEMTPEEKACCREMADQCGAMGMDSAHGCCARLQHEDFQFLQSTQSARHSLESAGMCIAPGPAAIAAPTALFYSAPDPEHSPPESPPHSFSILRI